MSRPERSSLWAGAGETLSLAVPLIAAQIAVFALGFIDTVTFGRLGTAALASGGLGTAVFSLVHMICVGVLSAVGNQVAFANGVGNQSAVRDAVSAGAIISVGLGISAGLATALGGSPLLVLMGQDPEAVAGASLYLSFVAPGILPSLLFTTLRGLTVGLERPGPITVITIGAVLLKTSLNLSIVLLIQDSAESDRVRLGLIWTGSTGAVAYAFMTIVLWWRCRQNFSDYLPRWYQVVPSAAVLRETMWLGVPIGITYGVEAGLFSGVALIVGRFGEVALAAHHVASQCAYLTFMLAVGLSHAASVRVGQAAGRGALAEARRYGRQALAMGLVAMSVPALVFTTMGRELAVLIVGSAASRGPEVVDLTAILLLVAACFQWFDCTQNIIMGALRGLKDSRATMTAAVLGYWLVGLPAAWLLSVTVGFETVGAWWGLAVGLAVTSAILVRRFEAVTSPRTPR